jgi:MoaA/NifB/PqqE/SkfB family radical SAM enzyme
VALGQAQTKPYRLTLSIYGATAEAYDSVTRRPGSFVKFSRGLSAAHDAGLPINLNVIVVRQNAHQVTQMTTMAERLGLPHHVFSNISPTIYGGSESLPAQSVEHRRKRRGFTGCNVGHTFFHVDPHGRASICKVGRDPQIDLIAEGIEGLARLGGIADALMLRTGGCSGCQLSGSCTVCRPLAKLYQQAKAPAGHLLPARTTRREVDHATATRGDRAPPGRRKRGRGRDRVRRRPRPDRRDNHV